MLRDRYEPMNLFALVPALSLALDPVLTQLDHLLDDDTLFQAVKADLARRRPRTLLTAARPRRSRSSCACWWSSISMAGATRRPSTGSVIVWCCASFAGCMPSRCRMIPPCSAGPT